MRWIQIKCHLIVQQTPVGSTEPMQLLGLPSIVECAILFAYILFFILNGKEVGRKESSANISIVV